MTREEAIEFGNMWLQINEDCKDSSTYAFFQMAIKALEQQTRDCKTCKRSNNGECAFTEECHECMWKSKYERQPCEDCISREDAYQ